MVILERTYDVMKAHIVVGFLNAANIDARLLDAEMSMMLPIVGGGVRIAVPAEQEMRAEQLLAELEDEQSD